jgi:alanine racemase
MDNQNQARPTVAEIDGRALAANFKELARLAGPQVGVLPVMKSDAYGHGFALVGRLLRDAGADRFGVATTPEGRDLRAAGVSGAILVLGGVYPAEYEHVVEARLAAVVWEAEVAAGLAARAREAGRVVPLHVKVDTGMSRLGAAPVDTAELITTLRALDGVTVEGLLTHFCNAEDVEGTETRRQLARFTELVRELDAAGLRPPIVHAANSAATLTTRAAHFDMVRPGLALYGIYPSEAMRPRAALKPVMRFVTAITAVRTVPEGTGVSYGATFVTQRRSRIATLPVGYADGYPRLLSNRAEVLVRDRRVPVVGRVCMDHTMIDVTDLPEAAVGDRVVLWGEQLPIEHVAALAETIPYEMMVRVGARVPRVAV